MPVDMIPFREEMFYEVTNANFTTDTAAEATPTRRIGVSPGNHGATYFRGGTLEYVEIRLNPANPVTYTFQLFEGNGLAHGGYELQSECLFRSWDNPVTDVAACADDTRYGWHGLRIPFHLTSAGNFWFNIDWSAAPGDTTGYIVIGGMREA
jgi:hypothetical protein